MTQQGISPLYVHDIRRISHEITVFVGEISVFGYVYPPLKPADSLRRCSRHKKLLQKSRRQSRRDTSESQRIGPEAMAGFSACFRGYPLVMTNIAIENAHL